MTDESVLHYLHGHHEQHELSRAGLEIGWDGHRPTEIAHFPFDEIEARIDGTPPQSEAERLGDILGALAAFVTERVRGANQPNMAHRALTVFWLIHRQSFPEHCQSVSGLAAHLGCTKQCVSKSLRAIQEIAGVASGRSICGGSWRGHSAKRREAALRAHVRLGHQLQDQPSFGVSKRVQSALKTQRGILSRRPLK